MSDTTWMSAQLQWQTGDVQGQARGVGLLPATQRETTAISPPLSHSCTPTQGKKYHPTHPSSSYSSHCALELFNTETALLTFSVSRLCFHCTHRAKTSFLSVYLCFHWSGGDSWGRGGRWDTEKTHNDSQWRESSTNRDNSCQRLLNLTSCSQISDVCYLTVTHLWPCPHFSRY